jgi:hypothetical protein
MTGALGSGPQGSSRCLILHALSFLVGLIFTCSDLAPPRRYLPMFSISTACSHLHTDFKHRDEAVKLHLYCAEQLTQARHDDLEGDSTRDNDVMTGKDATVYQTPLHSTFE